MEKLDIDTLKLHERHLIVYDAAVGFTWSDSSLSLTKALRSPRKECEHIFHTIDTLCEPSMLKRSLPGRAQLMLVDVEASLGIGAHRRVRSKSADHSEIETSLLPSFDPYNEFPPSRGLCAVVGRGLKVYACKIESISKNSGLQSNPESVGNLLHRMEFWCLGGHHLVVQFYLAVQVL